MPSMQRTLTRLPQVVVGVRRGKRIFTFLSLRLVLVVEGLCRKLTELLVGHTLFKV